MKKVILILIFPISFLSCSKECWNADLPEMTCDEGYKIIDSQSGDDFKYHKGFSDGKFYIIDTQTEYDSLFGGYTKDSIDFTKYTLIGADKSLNPCNGIKYQSYASKSINSDHYIFTAEYSLRNQCQGSGLNTRAVSSFWAKVPKIASKKDVEFHKVRDVNPFPDN